MNKICGYSCKHNKSGICQISVCDKKSNISDKTEVQTFTRYIDPTITELQQENQQLKIQISAREEEYRKLEETNKVLSHELTKDKILKQDHLTTCCGIPIGDIPKFINKYKKLEANWNKLKAFIVNEIPEEEFVNNEYYVSILDKMQELEQGSENNEK